MRKKEDILKVEFEDKLQKLKNNKWLNINFKYSEELLNCCKLCKSPKKEDIFNAFYNLTPQRTKVLILGQDPYPECNKAHGYAFSVANNKINDSLENIFKAIDKYKGIEYKKENHKTTNLSKWAENNGILLLNSSLTHEESERTIIEKHKLAWKPFIREILKNLLTNNDKALVIFLWGDNAKDTFFTSIKEIKNYIKIKRQILVLISNHPSNLSVNRGGNFPILAPNHFKACNDFLGKNNAIKWEKL